MGRWEPVNPADLTLVDERHLKETEAQLEDAWATIDDQAQEIDRWRTKAVALAKRMRAEARESELTRPAEPPAGTVVRKVSTGEVGVRDSSEYQAPWNVTDPARVDCADSRRWEDWIAPGEEIEIAEWVKP